MQEYRDKRLHKKCMQLYNKILTLKKMQIDDNYCGKLLTWFNEVTEKNIVIYKSKKDPNQFDQEKYQKKRQHVYWLDFGRNIGSEFQDWHFAIVIHESAYLATVVPVTSKKNYDPTWITENKKGIVDLGFIKGIPNHNKECYACPFMLQTVSKKRLSRISNEDGKKLNIKISDEQMDQICIKIIQIVNNKFDS